jgi:hypothetical protein
MQAQGEADGDGMTHARLGLVGRHHYYFPKVFYGFHEAQDPGRHDAVVVGNQDHRPVFLCCFWHNEFRGAKVLFFPSRLLLSWRKGLFFRRLLAF